MTAQPQPADAELHALRRADWRFLLPDAEVRRVVVAGSAAARHRRGLEADGVEVVELRDMKVGGPADAMVSSADPRLVEAVLRDHPHLAVYVELGSRERFDRRWWALLRRHRGSHFVVVPDHDRRRAYVPLGARLSLSWLGTAQGGLAAKVARSGLVDWSVARSAAGRLAPSRAVVFSDRPALHSIGAWAARAGLLDDHENLQEPVSHLIVTPRFATSRHVVLLAGRGDPQIVVKTSRLAGSGVDSEAAALRDLWVATGGRDIGAPRLLRHEPWGRRTIFAETMLTGTPLTAKAAAREPEVTAADLTSWLLRLPRGGGSTVAERLSNLLDPALEVVAASGGAGERDLVEATRRATRGLVGWDLPVVFEHGDVSAPNVIRTEQGVALIDWELAQPVGLPTHDLFVALGFVARSTGDRDPAAALERALLHSPPVWVRGELSRYSASLGLPTGALPALFVCCWARVAAALAARASVASTDLGWWRSQAATRLWKAAIERPELLDWMS